MTKLLSNEFMTLIKTKLFYVLLSIIVIASLSFTLFGLFLDTETFSKDDWRDKVAERVDQLEKKNIQLEEKGELSFSQSLDLELNIDKINRYTYHLNNDIIPPSQSSLFNNLNSSSILITLVAILSILVTSNLVPKEYKYGTIKNLIASPRSRFEILLSKYLVSVLFTLLLMLLMYLVVAVVSLIFFDVDQTKYLVLLGSSGYEHVVFWPYFLKLMLFQYIYMLVINTLSFTISIYLKSNSLSIIITFTVVFLSKPLTSFLANKTKLVKYSLTENWDLTKYLPANSGPLIDNMTLPFSIIMIIIYMIIMLIPVFFYFHKTDFK